MESKEPEEKRISKVIPGKMNKKEKKNSPLKGFIASDISEVCSYILQSVLIPRSKSLIIEILDNGMRRLLFGSSAENKTSRLNTEKVSYSSWSNWNPVTQVKPVRQLNDDNSFNYSDILFDTQEDAEDVVSEMNNIIAQYRFATVGDLYEIAAVSTNNPNVYKYGWKTLQGTSIVSITSENGISYAIKFPRARDINTF